MKQKTTKDIILEIAMSNFPGEVRVDKDAIGVGSGGSGSGRWGGKRWSRRRRGSAYRSSSG